MDCRDCARWDAEKGRCMDGKVNPPRYKDAIEVAQVLGVRAICIFNDHRDRLVSVREAPKAAKLGDLSIMSQVVFEPQAERRKSQA